MDRLLKIVVVAAAVRVAYYLGEVKGYVNGVKVMVDSKSDDAKDAQAKVEELEQIVEDTKMRVQEIMERTKVHEENTKQAIWHVEKAKEDLAEIKHDISSLIHKEEK